MSYPEKRSLAQWSSVRWFPFQWILTIALLLGWSACGKQPSPPITLEFEYEGCFSANLPVDDPICVLDERKSKLKVWARASQELPVTIKAGEQTWHSDSAEPIQGGFLFKLEGLDAPELSFHSGPEHAPALKTLRLAKMKVPAFKGKSLEELQAVSEADLPAAHRGEWLKALGRATADPEKSADYYADAAEAFEQAGQRSSVIHVLTARHYVLYHFLNRPGEAGEVLAALPAAPKGDVPSNFFAFFNRGAWARRNGRFRAALRDLEQAKLLAERSNMRLWYMADQERAILLSRLGRHDEAEHVIQGLETYASNQDPVGRAATLAELHSNVGWSRYLMTEAGRESDPIPSLTQALTAAEHAQSDELIKNAELNLALAFLQQNQPRQAHDHWARMAGLDVELPWWIETWAIEIEARLALAEGRAEAALDLYSKLAGKPESQFYPDAFWRAAVGQGRALQALGRWEEALTAFSDADSELHRLSVAVPLDEGRRGSTALYRRGALRHLELLVHLNRPHQALEVARRSRTRAFQGLVIESRLDGMSGGQRAEWNRLVNDYRDLQTQIRASLEEAELAAGDRQTSLQQTRVGLERRLSVLLDEALSVVDSNAEDLELPEVQGDPLWLVFHPLPEGWLGLAVNGQGIEMHRLPTLSPDLLGDAEAFSAAFLGPFAESIRRASKIRILPFGVLWATHFQALPWQGGILLDQAPIAYGLDLPTGSPRLESRRALLIADPSGSLVHAPQEIEDIERWLHSAADPWQTEVVSSSLGVSEALALLEQAGGLFHFAGHGDFFRDPETSSGRGGLVLQQGFDSRVALSVHDVLTLAQAPATVVLSGCDTLSTSSIGSSSGLGMGHAFLLAGSQSAVGAVEKVDDRRAETLIRLFYRHWQGPGSEAEALRLAQLELHRQDASGWSAFRVLER